MIPGMNLQDLLLTVGYIGLFAIIFAETGLFLGFFLPGDSLLFVAGLLASEGFFHPAMLFLIVFAAATLGNIFGYFFGYRVGAALFTRDDSILFKRSHAEKAAIFFRHYGAKSLVMARFMPIVRTFTPILAGVGRMDFRIFLAYNILGAFLWSAGLIFGGYFLGRVVPDIDRYILPIVVGIIIVSFLPGGIKYWQEKRRMEEKSGQELPVTIE